MLEFFDKALANITKLNSAFILDILESLFIEKQSPGSSINSRVITSHRPTMKTRDC